MTQDPQFVDQFMRIDLTGGVVRIELAVLRPPADGRQPELRSNGTLVLPLDGFMRSAATIESFVQQLVAKGIIRRESGTGGLAPREAVDKSTGRGPSQSPNFG